MKSKTQPALFQNFSIKTIRFLFFALVLASCKSTFTTNALDPSLFDYLERGNEQFNGLLVVNPINQDTLIGHNHRKYFIPASNVKIFTFYAGIKLQKARIPTLKYHLSDSTLFVQPTGDPTFLNPNFGDSTAFNFLKNYSKIALITNNYVGDKFMPGWAWEDYPYYFSPEITAFPIHRNVVQVYKNDSLLVSPSFFESKFSISDSLPIRKQHSNYFFVPNNLKDTLQIPFLTDSELMAKLLQDILDNEVVVSKKALSRNQVLHGMPTDSIYKQMLWESDNFTAEQLMLVNSSMLSDTLSFTKTRDFILENHLQGLKQQPRWVDGSGLSRYNLFTPESFVTVLNMLREDIREERLFHLFPAWNAEGTVQKPTTEENYFIYAKSGSMGNIYNLSGYLKTQQGKVLIFSLMSNNSRRKSSAIRTEMYRLLQTIHLSY
ncbi:D-alanyl-D-alanine carboxypeptidase [Croceivirga thetidis]|uniref:D-alanyl-D-alanine carboxypeptidase n=1 Tax=Croceivirga thetidis TaxID=2721623 RepID=A0ABX1GS53_9FLAO|nr:D-alanyl-D-alanine carboxypeptidase [Croceivirga thetidis]NKI32761.1 D-alanyl-D-alanine carboxypeptidase [Croceivirga thetidis]